MKLVCVDNKDWEDELTIGKIYDSYDNFDPTYYKIKSDLNQMEQIFNDRFESLEKYRNNQINKLSE